MSIEECISVVVVILCVTACVLYNMYLSHKELMIDSYQVEPKHDKTKNDKTKNATSNDKKLKKDKYNIVNTTNKSTNPPYFWCTSTITYAPKDKKHKTHKKNNKRR